MKRTIALVLFLTALLTLGKSCDKKPKVDGFKANKAELGQDWQQFKHDTSFNVWVFKEEQRPTAHLTTGGARIFWNGEVTQEEKDLADAGLSEMLSMCRPKFNYWLGKNVWNALYFNKISDYKIIQVPSNYTLQEGEAKGCAGMITGVGGVYTAAGTVGGLNDRWGSSSPGGEGGVYIIVPKQTPEQLARQECKTLMKNAIRNEGEHVLFSSSTQIYFAFVDGAPGVGNHPYCQIPNSSLLRILERSQTAE